MVATTQTTKQRQRRASKAHRLTFRVTDEVMQRLNEALRVSGRTLTEFVTEAAIDKADEVIERERVLRITERDMEALPAALENPPEPNETLLRAYRRRRELIAESWQAVEVRSERPPRSE
jgi:uncharacterized protein (DUF1778 family)